MQSSEYKVNEIFETIQGEGSYTGAPAIFVRLQGCPVGCAWCDTKHTWEIEPEHQVADIAVFKPSGDKPVWSAMSVERLLHLFEQNGFNAKHVVITGGEPCMYDLVPLCDGLHQAGYSTQIETSGTFEVKAPDSTWVTVSPKVNMKGGYPILSTAMLRANEIKHPIAMQKHIDELDILLQQHKVLPSTPIYLQPISQQKRATELAITTCIARNWRLSVQVHKYLGIE